MTVADDTSSGDIVCQWFAGSKLERGVFPTSSLVHVEESEKGRLWKVFKII